MEEFIRLRDAVISYLKEKNRSPSTIENYYSCFNRFERHLKENGIPFSFEAVDLWLDEVTSNLSAIEVNIYRTPMRRLKDTADGDIKPRHFSQKRLMTYPLCQRFKDLLDRFLSTLDGYSEHTIANRRKYCCSILLCFQENGVYSPAEITYELLLKTLAILDDSLITSQNTKRYLPCNSGFPTARMALCWTTCSIFRNSSIIRQAL